MSEPRSLHLFEGLGIEIELMVVDRETLAVRPVVDRLLAEAAGAETNMFDDGPIGWSNELVNHVVELKNNDPRDPLDRLGPAYRDSIARINGLLAGHQARLMPGAMHATMDPARETALFPHTYHDIYAAYDKIFDCRRHGWANLQSVHINLPFANEDEFARLHAACRLVLPLIPAIAAASPYADGMRKPWHDYRLEVYRTNGARVPILTGQVVPEPIWTFAEYEKLLARLDAQLAPYDEIGSLQGEWINARGVIARFDRNALEIRVVDMQESVGAALAITAAIVLVVKALVEERWQPLVKQQAWATEPLFNLLYAVAREGEHAYLADGAYLAAFGIHKEVANAGDVWRTVLQTLAPTAPQPWQASLEHAAVLLEHGTLASRLLRAGGDTPDPDRFRAIAEQLCSCLEKDLYFEPAI